MKKYKVLCIRAIFDYYIYRNIYLTYIIQTKTCNNKIYLKKKLRKKQFLNKADFCEMVYFY